VRTQGASGSMDANGGPTHMASAAFPVMPAAKIHTAAARGIKPKAPRARRTQTSPSRARAAAVESTYSTEQMQLALQGMRSENSQLAKRLKEATMMLEKTVEHHKAKQRNPSTLSKRAVRKVQKQIEEQAALRERLLEKLDSVLQTGRIKELEGAISTVAEQCKNLVRDTRMMQQATARQEKKWVHGDEDAKKKENEFRVALQQNDGLKHKMHQGEQKLMHMEQIVATEESKLAELQAKLQGYDYSLHVACNAARDKAASLGVDRAKLNKQADTLERVLKADRKRARAHASSGGDELRELRKEVERLRNLIRGMTLKAGDT